MEPLYNSLKSLFSTKNDKLHETLRDVNERYEAQKVIDSLRDEAEYLKDEIQSIYNLGEIIGESKAFRKTLQLAAEVASTDTSVLIYGETGTGKELIARAIHASSLRKDRPLITVNCAAIPETLMESEFFGHENSPRPAEISSFQATKSRCQRNLAALEFIRFVNQ